MLKKILCVGYREWSVKIYRKLEKNKKFKVKIIKKNENLKLEEIKKFNPDLILFYGWSKKVNINIITKYKSYMLHPSNLPKFRGGSPIQNQIIRGITKTKLTLFRMNGILDGGNILKKIPISLDGNINNIFEEIYEKGLLMTKELLKNRLKEKKQILKLGSIYKRRKEAESEITLKEIKTKSSVYLYNKIRMLTDPYPNAFIKCKDNKKLYIIGVKL
tara:strand:+ start:13 stop:663 length:651 start_codon:yes stop_codon:yes gene_type:complete